MLSLIWLSARSLGFQLLNSTIDSLDSFQYHDLVSSLQFLAAIADFYIKEW
jgi:hypothetical protein